MTQDDIIRMAVTCQLITTANRDGIYMKALERFAELVRADATSGYSKKIEELIEERDALRALAQPEERPWVGLTDGELFEIMDKANTRYQAVQMTQAKLRELNELQIDPNKWAFDNGLEST